MAGRGALAAAVVGRGALAAAMAGRGALATAVAGRGALAAARSRAEASWRRVGGSRAEESSGRESGPRRPGGRDLVIARRGGGVSDEFDLSVPGRKMMLELISPLNFVN